MLSKFALEAYAIISVLSAALTWIPGGCDQTLAERLANIPASWSGISTTAGNFPVIPDYAFSSFSHLSSLSLTLCKIQLLGPHAFHNLTNLEYFDLSSNFITNLPPGLFQTVGQNSNEIYIDLASNHICTIPLGVFDLSPQLKALRLGGNKISCLPEGLFSPLKFADVGKQNRAWGQTQFVLAGNQLSYISAEILQIRAASSDGFYSLSLEHNTISYLPANLTSLLPDFDKFLLGYNEIEYIHPLAFSPNRPSNVLDLSYNKITCLSEGIQIYSSFVDLSDNQLSIIPVLIETSEIDLGVTNILCSSVCWAKLPSYPSVLMSFKTCENGVRWYDWDGLDSNGQCVILQVPDCPPPLTLPSQTVCPTQCPVLRHDLCELGLTEIPSYMPTAAEVIHLCNNDITSIPDQAFSSFSALTVLQLDYNKISSVPGNSFSTSLIELHLDHNHIDYIHPQAFHSLSSLTYLYLSDNYIGEIHYQTFYDLISLRRLDLTNNKIESLPAFETVANNNPSSTNELGLYLSYNNVISFPTQAFTSFSTLTHLILHNNQIASLPGNSFPSSLKTLYLEYNNIDQIHPQAFHNLSKLEEIHLYENRITTLPAGLFTNLPQLTGLYLSNNRIRHVPAGLFTNLPQLTGLYLSNNRIRHVPAGLFATVGTDYLKVHLSNNDICTLDADVFLESPTFARLDFDNNKISCLPPNVFAETESFEFILSNNEITAISPEILALNVLQGQELHPLTKGVDYDHWYWFILSLRGNKITYIPADILSHITNGVVDELDLSDNFISFIHPDAFREYVPEVLKLNNNQLTCLPEGLFLMVSPDIENYLNLRNNQLDIVHPEEFFGTEFTYPLQFDIHRTETDDWYANYYYPSSHVYIYLDSNPLENNCKALCWLKHTNADGVSVNCQDGTNWDSWDGLDSNGQCAIPPAPACPPPSSIPVAPTQCSPCSGKWKLARVRGH